MHDLASFITYEAAINLDIPLYFFPAYYGWPEKRSWSWFVNNEKPDYKLKLDKEQINLKKRVVEVHNSQKDFMNSLLSNPDSKLFFLREVLRKVTNKIDYTKTPTEIIGYEYPGSKIKFEDFRKVIEKVKSA